MCALVGRQIGVGNSQEAKRITGILLFFCALIDAIEFYFLNYYQDEIVSVFLRHKDLEEIGKEIIWVLLVALAFDFFQQVLGGVLNALGK